MPIELRSGAASATILPEFGGRLHQLSLMLDGREQPLLASPSAPASYISEPTRGGSFPMAPWPNRVRDGTFSWAGRSLQLPTGDDPNAIHGLVHTAPWQVVARTARVVELTCDFDPGWPWAGRAWQRYELRDDLLRMKMEVRSAREAFPAGCGWHPWFRRDVAGATGVSVAVPAIRRYVLDSQLPTGETVVPAGAFLLDGRPLGARRLDDCYAGLSGPVVVDWGALSLSISIDCPFPHVLVYSPPEAFCIEAQTCAPDAFNLANQGSTTEGLGIARPGSPVSLTSEWRWQ